MLLTEQVVNRFSIGVFNKVWKHYDLFREGRLEVDQDLPNDRIIRCVID